MTPADDERPTGSRSGSPSPDPTRVFETTGIFETWDDDFYHPAALALFDRAIPWMLQRLGATPGSLVLDAGCGPGVHSIRAARSGCRVHAVDVSASVIDKARERARRAGVEERITFGVEDLTQLTLEDASHRHVFAWGVLTHIPEMARALDELARVVAPGGRLALEITNGRAWDHALLPVLRRFARRPPLRTERHALGRGTWHEIEGESLWFWHADIDAIAAHLEQRGLRLVHRRPGEFTNIHWKVGGWVGRVLMRVNEGWFRLGLPAGPCATNLLVFEKCEERSASTGDD